jgi:hypothetical protein
VQKQNKIGGSEYCEEVWMEEKSEKNNEVAVKRSS